MVNATTTLFLSIQPVQKFWSYMIMQNRPNRNFLSFNTHTLENYRLSIFFEHVFLPKEVYGSIREVLVLHDNAQETK